MKEGLHNAVRHGKPHRIEVRLEADGGVRRARIVDDGRGLLLEFPLGASPAH